MGTGETSAIYRNCIPDLMLSQLFFEHWSYNGEKQAVDVTAVWFDLCNYLPGIIECRTELCGVLLSNWSLLDTEFFLVISLSNLQPPDHLVSSCPTHIQVQIFWWLANFHVSSGNVSIHHTYTGPFLSDFVNLNPILSCWYFDKSYLPQAASWSLGKTVLWMWQWCYWKVMKALRSGALWKVLRPLMACSWSGL